MEKLLTQVAEIERSEKTPRPRPTRVCMHVLMPIETDIRVEREARTLMEHGYEVTIVDLAGEASKALVEVHPALKTRHLAVPRNFATVRFRKWAIIRALSLFLRALLLLLGTPADIYHAHDFNALPATYLAARLKRKPLIYDAHELPLAELSLKARWVRRLSEALLRHMVPRCCAVISVSPPILQVLRDDYHATRVALVRNIPWYQSVPNSDLLRQRLQLSPETRLLLFQGYLGADRALDLLVKSARLLRSQAVIVLLGPPRPEVLALLEDLIVREGVAERLRILPAVPYAELFHWTASADVGLALFRPEYSLNVRWCLPNKLFEYIMAGLPVLSSPLDAVRDLLEEQQLGRVVEDMTPEGIAAAIDALLAEPELLEHMRQRALTLARGCFCWEQECQQLLKLYAQVNSSWQSSAESV